jgi:hypothetical protein
MFNRILYIIGERPEDRQFVLELARTHASSVLLFALVTAEIPELQQTEGATHRRVLLEDRERKSWQRLYRLEGEFKAAGVKCSVMAQQGVVADVETLAHNTRCDLIVIGASSLADANYRLPDEFIPHLPCPIVILPTA